MLVVDKEPIKVFYHNLQHNLNASTLAIAKQQDALNAAMNATKHQMWQTAAPLSKIGLCINEFETQASEGMFPASPSTHKSSLEHGNSSGQHQEEDH